MSKKAKKIAILGFGLTGRIAALMLYKKHQICVFERGAISGEQSAGFVAAAMLAPLAESVMCDRDLAEQGLSSIAMWQQLIGELDDPIFFQQAGSLVLAHTQDKGDLESFSQRLKPLNGFHAERLNRAQIAHLEPELEGRFEQGIYLPCEGQIDNLAFYKASLKTLQKANVALHEYHNAELNPQDYDYVIDCRGIGAKHALTGLRGVRGEVVRLRAPEVTLCRPIRLMHPRYPIYIVPKPNNEYVIGATEVESQSTKPMTLRSAMELLSAAYTIHSGFAEAEIISFSAGLRPSMPDNRPSVTQQGNTISINGLYRHGYLLSPSVVAQALTYIE